MRGLGELRRFAKWGMRCLPLVTLIVMVAAPSTAHAHLVTSGAGPFFDGVAHFFVSPDDLLVVVALSLFSGLLGKTPARMLVVMLPFAWLTGMAVGLLLAERIDGGSWTTAITLLLGGLLLGFSPKLPTWALATVTVMFGLMHGGWNGAAMRATETSAVASLGIVTATSVVALLLSAMAVSLNATWQKIAFRVVGSWVAAFGLLALAWHFRPNA